LPVSRRLLSVRLGYGLHARQVAIATLSIEAFSGFVTSAAASTATGWSEPVPGRDLHPLKTNAFSPGNCRPIPHDRHASTAGGLDLVCRLQTLQARSEVIPIEELFSTVMSLDSARTIVGIGITDENQAFTFIALDE
jgi:hypothetical protein